MTRVWSEPESPSYYRPRRDPLILMRNRIAMLAAAVAAALLASIGIAPSASADTSWGPFVSCPTPWGQDYKAKMRWTRSKTSAAADIVSWYLYGTGSAPPKVDHIEVFNNGTRIADWSYFGAISAAYAGTAYASYVGYAYYRPVMGTVTLFDSGHNAICRTAPASSY